MLDETARRLLAGTSYAAFTSLLPGGQPSTHLMWVGSDDTHVLINTKTDRQKLANVKRDPRVVVTVFEPGNLSCYSEIRGHVVEIVGEPEARAHFDELSVKYTGAPWGYPTEGERVVLRIEPDRVRSVGGS